MKTLSWNCRGICNSSTVKALRATIRAHHPSVIFLSETKAKEDRIAKVAVMLGFSNYFCVDARGKAGGICVFWSQNVHLDVVEFGHNLIALKVSDYKCCWYLVGFYSSPHKSKRRPAWEDLNALLNSFAEPWVCVGDFNIILDDSEKEGGNSGGSSAPNFLRDLMFDLGAIDLGFTGNKFTWSNKR